MDKSVIEAMAKWPNVPHVYGWLSLNERGQWRLHPAGDALRGDLASPGEAIGSAPILAFIGRNYVCDESGQWFFQNGPQRVYVRLDAAPFILRTEPGGQGQAALLTHTGLPAVPVRDWLLADDGRLYAWTPAGPGLMQGHDIEAVLGALRTLDDTPVLDALDPSSLPADPLPLAASHLAGSAGVNDTDAPARDGALLHFCAAGEVEKRLGFIRHPRPSAARADIDSGH
ncbi:DUF2946 family protein [Allopusillimonas soli]|uniref:DUF2946 family protein n=1 Tax=Allopusillimonas soli TaxID=659016 RepID=A0A853FM76_9BURK|nr:DUF2946 family protein [Allopusillimonas soli]NYT39006.1 DUF2946 family protein [Allopusillimonas soli]TEA69554.1 DUF2946 family protein [Allopusillimonas soli]